MKNLQFDIYHLNNPIASEEELLEDVKEVFGEDILNENFEILNESDSKFSNFKWKMAKFSLRYLSNEALSKFLAAYYSDKEGNMTDKSYEWMKASKHSKVKKMREIAEQLTEEQKAKVINCQAANQLSKKAKLNYAGHFGALVTTAGAGYASWFSLFIHAIASINKAENLFIYNLFGVLTHVFFGVMVTALLTSINQLVKTIKNMKKTAIVREEAIKNELEPIIEKAYKESEKLYNKYKTNKKSFKEDLKKLKES